MTTEGQGRAADPVGLGIPVMIDGPVGRAADLSGYGRHPRQSRCRLCQAQGDGQGPVRPERRRTWCGDRRPARRRTKGAAGGQGGGAAGGQAGAASLPARSAASSARPSAICCSRAWADWARAGSGRLGQGGARPSGQRSIPSPASPAESPRRPRPRRRSPHQRRQDAAAQQDSQPMNEVLRQLFNR